LGSYIGPVENYKNTVGAKVESICGRFYSGFFRSAMADLQNGIYATNNDYINYLKVDFPS
jgi:hypothetical protein